MVDDEASLVLDYPGRMTGIIILSTGEVYNPSGYILQTSRPAPEKKFLTQKQALELLRLRGFVIKDDPHEPASA